MGQTKRDKLRRELAKAHNNLERALGNIQVVHAQFAPVHLEYAEFLEKMAQTMILTQEMIMVFWERAWGKRPGDIDSWRK